MYCPCSVTGAREGNLEAIWQSILLRLTQLFVTVNYNVGDTRELRFISDLMERGSS
jgi:hypothetical protein